MEKILVTTDFSDNSLAGLRFAIQLATQRQLELMFLHVTDLWDTTVLRTPDQLDLLKREKTKVLHKLESLVNATYKSMNVKPGKYQCVLHYHFGVINSILDYAAINDCHFICISTNGAGKVLKLLGTNTAELIKESRIPVLCIPRTYQSKLVSSLLYATDMTNYEKELKMVVAFGKPIHAAIYMLNIMDPGMRPDDTVITEDHLASKFNYGISYIFQKKENNIAFAENIDIAVQKYSPSLLVMFTNQERNLLELMFAPSQTEKYSFRTKIPLLVYAKG